MPAEFGCGSLPQRVCYGCVIDLPSAPPSVAGRTCEEHGDSSCQLCQTPFHGLRRRHHCRACGRAMCGSCGANYRPLPALGHTTPVRVCSLCATAAASKQRSPSPATLPPTDRDALLPEATVFPPALLPPPVSGVPDGRQPYAQGEQLTYPIQMGFRPLHPARMPTHRCEALLSWGVTLSRRYSDFAWLHAQLCSHWPHQILPRFPGALLRLPRPDEDSPAVDEGALARRQAALQVYLRALLHLKQLKTSTLLKQFLCPGAFYSAARQVGHAPRPSSYLELA